MMTITAATALLALALQAGIPDGLADALDAQRADDVAAVDVVRVGGDAGRCRALAWDAPKVSRSGRVRVRGRGDGCAFWLSVDVLAQRDVAVLTRDVAKGDRLDGAFVVKRVTHGSGAVPAPGARAARVMKAGATVNAGDIGPAVAPGTKVPVTLVSGELRIEDVGTIVACANATCARTRGGALVKGTMQNGALVVEVQ